MIRTAVVLLVVATLCLVPAAAQEQPVACGAVLDRPGSYVLASDLSCPFVPPGPFCDTPAIAITAPNVRLDGRGFTLSGNAGIGIRVTATGAVVQNISIAGFRVGVQISGGGENQLNGVRTSSVSLGCDDRGTGVELLDTSDNVITSSDLSGSIDWGVRMERSRGNRIANGRIVETRFAPGDPAANVLLVSSDENTIVGNDLSRGGLWGVRLEGSNRNLIGSNIIDETANTVPFGIGIVLVDSSRNTVLGNRMDRVPLPATMHTGLLLSGGSTNNRILNNDVFNHTGSGLRIGPRATGNLIYFNEAAGNTPFDAEDQNPECDDNRWKGNLFVTTNQPCVEGALKGKR